MTRVDKAPRNYKKQATDQRKESKMWEAKNLLLSVAYGRSFMSEKSPYDLEGFTTVIVMAVV